MPSVECEGHGPSGKSMDAMSNRTKQRRSGGLSLLLYQRSLHPELFNILASEKISRRAYEADVWLVEGGHVIAFTAGSNALSEVIVTNPDTSVLTDRALVQSIPCRGERYHEMTSGNIRYMISTQEEQLSQTLYDATRHEIVEYATKRELMMAEVPARNDAAGSLHVLDIERRSHELLVQSFHLFDENQMVVKTQGILEVVKNA
ncbi:MAG: DUF2617 family protein [Phycisphaerales bacterium]|nr:DUF2617 family protein [Phycisphaerales bacterium]